MCLAIVGLAGAQAPQTFTPKSVVALAAGGDRERSALSQVPGLAEVVRGQFAMGVADLDGNGSNEIIVVGSACDAQGCPVVALQNRGGGQTAVIFSRRINGRIAVTAEKIGSYHALAAADAAGAITASNGRQNVYAVGNTAAAPAPAAAPAAAAAAPAATARPPGAQPTAAAPLVAQGGATPDVLGIKVGASTVSEVRTVLDGVSPDLLIFDVDETILVGKSAINPNRDVEVPASKHVSALEAMTAEHRTYATQGGCPTSVSQTPGAYCERFAVQFSGPPGEPRATSVNRWMTFGSGPALNTLVQSLTEKYGEPSFVDNRNPDRYEMRWHLRADGTRIAMARENDACGECAVTIDANINARSNVVFGADVRVRHLAAKATADARTVVYLREAIAAMEAQQQRNAAGVASPSL